MMLGTFIRLIITTLSFIFLCQFENTNAQTMIIRASGPMVFQQQYKQGKQLDPDAVITLPDNARLSILTKTGVKVLKGPATVSLSDNSRRTISAVQRLREFFAHRNAKRASLAVIRTDATNSKTREPSNIWQVDIRSKRACVQKGQPVFLWRNDPDFSAEYSLVDTEAQKKIAILFKKGSLLYSWPLELLPLDNLTIFRLSNSNKEGHNIIIVPVDIEDESDIFDVASILLESGCEDQVTRLNDKFMISQN